MRRTGRTCRVRRVRRARPAHPAHRAPPAHPPCLPRPRRPPHLPCPPCLRHLPCLPCLPCPLCLLYLSYSSSQVSPISSRTTSRQQPAPHTRQQHSRRRRTARTARAARRQRQGPDTGNGGGRRPADPIRRRPGRRHAPHGAMHRARSCTARHGVSPAAPLSSLPAFCLPLRPLTASCGLVRRGPGTRSAGPGGLSRGADAAKIYRVDGSLQRFWETRSKSRAGGTGRRPGGARERQGRVCSRGGGGGRAWGGGRRGAGAGSGPAGAVCWAACPGAGGLYVEEPPGSRRGAAGTDKGGARVRLRARRPAFALAPARVRGR